MENLTNLNPNLAGGDLMELSPMKLPNSILKASEKENLIVLQTPKPPKHLKVSFITPRRTPVQTPLQPIKVDGSSNVPGSGSVMLETTHLVLNTPSQITTRPQNLAAGLQQTPKTGIQSLRKGIMPRRVGVSSDDTITASQKIDSKDTPVANSSMVKPMEVKIPQKTTNSESRNNKWDSLRKLDENLRWRERVEVITKLDHQEYIECARECVLQLIDKVVDVSVSNQRSHGPFSTTSVSEVECVQLVDKEAINVSISKRGSHGSVSTTPVSKVMTPISAGIISSIVPNTTPMMQAAEILTPISTTNGTFEISTSGSFLSERAAKDPFQLNQCGYEPPMNDENARFKIPSGVLKPVSVRPKKSSLITPRSRSMSDNCLPGGGSGDVKNEFTIGPRSFSCDLDNIPEDIDPFPAKTSSASNSNTTPLPEVYNRSADPFRAKTSSARYSNTTPLPELYHRSANAMYDISADQSVFMTPEARPFALRPIDFAFGNEEFGDGGKILDQLDLDYLDKKTTGAISQDLRKQSLYVKFDPLLEGLGNRTSISLLGRKSDIIDFNGRVTPVLEPTEEANISPREPDLLCDSPSRIASETTFDCSQLPMRSTSSLGDSVSSSSPCPQSASAAKPDTGIIEVLKYSEKDIQRILNRKKEKWAKEREASIAKCDELEKLIRDQKLVVKDYQERCEEHGKAVSEEREQQERKIAALKEDKKRIEAQILTLTKATGVLSQRSEMLQKNLSNLEANKVKQSELMEAFREKRSASQKKINDLELETAEAVKKIAAEKNEFEINIAGQLSGLQTRIKATEFKLRHLQATLDHKRNENKELMKICDELVASNEVH